VEKEILPTGNKMTFHRTEACPYTDSDIQAPEMNNDKVNKPIVLRCRKTSSGRFIGLKGTTQAATRFLPLWLA
jgi:hypothetical protein